MFINKTVFILGAGASWHYGYPTGEELVKEVRKKCAVLRDHLRWCADDSDPLPTYVADKVRTVDGRVRHREAWEESLRECQELGERLRIVDPPVIDYFLALNRPLHDIGRLLITWVIRERETKPKVQDGDWYRFILNRLVVGCETSESLLKNNVTFVTFNYDVSLEDALGSRLQSLALFDTAHVADFLSADRFLHVYGKVRGDGARKGRPINCDVYEMRSREAQDRYSNNPMKRKQDWKELLDDLFESSKFIRTIDPHDKGAEEDVLRRASEVIEEAVCVYILGFGFDPRNCARIGLHESLRRHALQAGRTKRILFTNLRDINRVNKSASKLFFGHPHGFPPNRFIEGSMSEPYYVEKSFRNCYGALALDFDEIEAEP